MSTPIQFPMSSSPIRDTEAMAASRPADAASRDDAPGKDLR